MDKLEAKSRIQKLKEQIEELRYKYHVLDDPTVTDDIYESLGRELKGLEELYPEFHDEHSPSNRIAGRPLDKFVKVKHDVRMLSLNDAFSLEELEAWEKRIKKLLPPGVDVNYFCELKLDGLSVSLIYQDGRFIRGATRGDGLVGEDVTQNLKTISAIPLELNFNLNHPQLKRLKTSTIKYLEVRGEGVMSKKVLQELNAKYQKEGKSLLANTRNAAAGSLRQLDSILTAERKLSFFAWDIVKVVTDDGDIKISSHSEKHELLRELGFKVDKNERKCRTIIEVEKFIREVEKLRPDFPYGTDGVVVSVDQLEYQQILGVVGKAPRYMVAYKYPAEKATTIIKEIKFNVGRTGVLTPLAIFEPTLVAGSTIGKATLHNMDQINRLDVRVGDTVIIQKAGDVIPEVVEVLPKMRNGKEKKVLVPKECPVCGEDVEQRITGDKKQSSVAYYCSNPK